MITLISNKRIGDRLKILRSKIGKNQEKVANDLGISRARYSHYENNHVEPDIDLIKKFAEYHNVTTDYLLGGSDNPHLTEDEAFADFIKDPSLRRWFKSLPQSEEEDIARLKRIWDAFKTE